MNNFPPLKYNTDFLWVYEVELSKLENTIKLKQIWDDFNANGVDAGSYHDSSDEDMQKENVAKNTGTVKKVTKGAYKKGRKGAKRNNNKLKNCNCPVCGKHGHTASECRKLRG